MLYAFSARLRQRVLNERAWYLDRLMPKGMPEQFIPLRFVRSHKIKVITFNQRFELLHEENLLENKKYTVLNSGPHNIPRLIFCNRTIYPHTDCNMELMRHGKAPLDYDGKKVVIHHFDQKHDSPLIVMPHALHESYHNLLHFNKPQVDKVDRNKFKHERANFWKGQYQYILQIKVAPRMAQ